MDIKMSENREDINGESSSDSDSDSDLEDISMPLVLNEENTQRLTTKYNNLFSFLKENKCSYTFYVKLMELAYRLHDLTLIRQAFDELSSVFPVYPKIWLMLLEIECNKSDYIARTEELFRRALKEFYSISVIIEFGKFAKRSPNGDLIWKELIDVYAFNPIYGKDIFRNWREYINQTDIEPKEKKQQILKSYIKELSLPLQSMEETYLEFNDFISVNKEIVCDVSKVTEQFLKAKDIKNLIIEYEWKIVEIGSEDHQSLETTYMTYITKMKDVIEENFIQILYEKMVGDCSSIETCWLNYVKYLEDREDSILPERLVNYDLFKQTPIVIIDRGIKNCPLSTNIVIKKIQLLEKENYSLSDIQKVFEDGIAIEFLIPEPMVELWLIYLTCLRRHTNFQDIENVNKLRKCFELAWDNLGTYWGALADCNCEILQLWGKLEYGPLNDPKKGKELWGTVMESADNQTKSALWIEFAQMEAQHNLKGARKLFLKAICTESIDNIASVAMAWQRFERCYGSLENNIFCEEYCKPILKITQVDTSYTETLQEPIKRNLKRKSNPNKKKNTEMNFKKTEYPVEKRRKLENINITAVNKQRDNEDNLQVFLSNLDYNITEDQIKSAFPELKFEEIDIVKTSRGKSKGYANVKLSSAEEVAQAISLDRREINGRSVFISNFVRKRDERQKISNTDANSHKIFVRGIPDDSTEEELRQYFNTYGEVKLVKIAYNKEGKSRGFAYIEYKEKKSVSAAIVALDNTEFKGSKITVEMSNPIIKNQSINKPKSTNKMFFSRKQPMRQGQKPRMSFIPSSVYAKVSADLKKKSAEKMN